MRIGGLGFIGGAAPGDGVVNTRRVKLLALSAALLGVATFFLSVVPVGPPLVWGPAAIWLYYQGQPGWAIFLVIWGVAVVSSIDNFLKPLLISRGSNLPFILVLRNNRLRIRGILARNGRSL